ncbi:hypothetical protein BC830DRAFT_1168549 [Chytriomyces sp. MP71]|nr:hypothetical protein BC830DRAFT_1168549 [Chytriomyces sp. MP71]
MSQTPHADRMDFIKSMRTAKVTGRARSDSVSKRPPGEPKKEKTALQQVGHAFALIFTELARTVTYVLFYFLAFSGYLISSPSLYIPSSRTSSPSSPFYVRSSDFLNDLQGVNVAATNAHRAILPYVNFTTIDAAYGFPIERSSFDVISPMSVQLRLTADTNVLNNLPPTVSGSTAYWAGLATKQSGVKDYASVCKKTLNSTSPYVIETATTIVQAKSNLPGQEVMAWSGYVYAPSTQKAVTRVVKFSAIPDHTGNCTYAVKMFAQEAFELWEPVMVTWNAYELNLVADRTGHWTFLPEETRFNWFFYRQQRTEVNVMAGVSQVMTVLIMATGVLWRTPRGLTIYLDMDEMASRYYNSIIINLAEAYIVFTDRFIIFRTVNAIDFFLTGGWGFDSFTMLMQFVNIIGGFFFVILLIQKLVALILYAVAIAVKAAYDSRKRSIAKDLELESAHDEDQDASPNFWLTLVKEGFRPNPELILLATVISPKYFYAGFYGGATKWGPVSMANVSAAGSCLGANLLMWNLLVTTITICPLNFFMILLDGGMSLSNSWVRCRLPGRVYNGYRDLINTITNKHVMKDTAENRLISAVEGPLAVLYAFFLFRKRGEKSDLHYTVRVQNLVQDSVFSEVDCVRACFFVEDVVDRWGGSTDDALRRRRESQVCIAVSADHGLMLRWADGGVIHIADLEALCFRKMQVGPCIPLTLGHLRTIRADSDEAMGCGGYKGEKQSLIDSCGSGEKTPVSSIRAPSLRRTLQR